LTDPKLMDAYAGVYKGGRDFFFLFFFLGQDSEVTFDPVRQGRQSRVNPLTMRTALQNDFRDSISTTPYRSWLGMCLFGCATGRE
jgi:hypothetical protein